MSKIPIGYIIDDGGLVNTYHFHNPNVEHPVKVPIEFAKRFAKICRTNGVKGKYSVVPMPGCIGRLDQGLLGFTKAETKAFVKLIKNEIEPQFSITPEVLTHFRAYNMKRGTFLHVFEDVYFSTLEAEPMSDYIGLALEILSNVGLDPSGLTSPWMCGIENEENYSKAIGMAFVKKLGKRKCFYFMHCRDEVTEPVVMQNSRKTGRVTSIPALTEDAFWDTQRPSSKAAAKAAAKKNIDELLAPNGKKGIIIDLLETGKPVTLLTHWQSLFSDGAEIGLDGFETLTARINRHLGSLIEWQSFAEIAGIN